MFIFNKIKQNVQHRNRLLQNLSMPIPFVLRCFSDANTYPNYFLYVVIVSASTISSGSSCQTFITPLCEIFSPQISIKSLTSHLEPYLPVRFSLPCPGEIIVTIYPIWAPYNFRSLSKVAPQPMFQKQ